MTEIQFLVDLLMRNDVTQEVKEIVASRIKLLYALPQITYPSIPIPFMGGVDLCNHEYPSSWYGIVPPSCIKCGKQAYAPYIITSGTFYSSKSDLDSGNTFTSAMVKN